MKNTACLTILLSLLLGSFGLRPVEADTFGSGANTFAIDFVNIGNAGNANDTGAGGGIYSSLYGGVDYDYRISVYAIRQSDITNATASGLTNVTAGGRPANNPATSISWYEAAAFVNWLNTSTGHQAAYDLSYNGSWSLNLWGESERASSGVQGGINSFRHKDAFYFLPGESEWYKAAYHQNDGVTANYWDYATGSNSIPTSVASGSAPGTSVYGSQSGPADVDQAGGFSSYGTMGQGGNTYEWFESAFDGSNNLDENHGFRGGYWAQSEQFMRSSSRQFAAPANDYSFVGFRVASVPEPSSTMLIILTLGALSIMARKRSLR